MDAAFDDVRGGGVDLEAGRYLVKVTRLEPAPSTNPEYGPSIKWVFQLATVDTKQVIVTEDGETPFEYYAYTSTKLGAKSKAGLWARALLNRDLKVGESGQEVAAALLGTKAVALIGPNEAGYLRILSMEPLSSLKQRTMATASAAEF